MNLLIKAGADIHIVDVKGQTPLFVAVKNRRLECARLLLQNGACPDGDLKNSSTPLNVAFMNGDINSVLVSCHTLKGNYHQSLKIHDSQFSVSQWRSRYEKLRQIFKFDVL